VPQIDVRVVEATGRDFYRLLCFLYAEDGTMGGREDRGGHGEVRVGLDGVEEVPAAVCAAHEGATAGEHSVALYVRIHSDPVLSHAGLFCR